MALLSSLKQRFSNSTPKSTSLPPPPPAMAGSSLRTSPEPSRISTTTSSTSMPSSMTSKASYSSSTPVALPASPPAYPPPPAAKGGSLLRTIPEHSDTSTTRSCASIPSKSSSTASSTPITHPVSPPAPPPRAPPTIKVKLRNNLIDPPTTALFTLPRTRALQTSAYFRDHVSADGSTTSSPQRRNKDDIIRLNFPDFDIFAIYAEWLDSGEIFSKTGLRTLYSGHNHLIRGDRDLRTRKAFEDFLGAYFLGSWLRDTAFKDTLVSTIISKVNASDGNGRLFVRALRPPTVNLVCADMQGSNGMKTLMYAAVSRWGTEEDIARLVPDDGETSERGFVQGLMRYLLLHQRERKVGDVDINDERVHGGNGELGGNERRAPAAFEMVGKMHDPRMGVGPPPPFMPEKPEWWQYTSAASHVSWPSTSTPTLISSALETSTSTTVTVTEVDDRNDGEMAGDEMIHAKWPEKQKDECVFHEHKYLGEKCWRRRMRWDVRVQKMVFDR